MPIAAILELLPVFALGYVAMVAVQTMITVFLWRKGNNFTTEGWRISWTNAKTRDFEIFVRLLFATGLIALALPQGMVPSTFAWGGGALLGLITRVVSDLLVVLMRRWGIKASNREVKSGARRPAQRGRGRDR